MLEKTLLSLKAYLSKIEHRNMTSEYHDFALCAEELRFAAKWLGYITGKITSEDVLDIIFKDFCIGK